MLRYLYCHSNFKWSNTHWHVLRRVLVGCAGKHAHGFVERRDIRVEQKPSEGVAVGQDVLHESPQNECQISDTVSFKKRKSSREKHREWEIYSFSFIWHGSSVILWWIICTFCFRPLGGDWSAQWDLLYASGSIRFDISWFNSEESISGWICHFEAQTQYVESINILYALDVSDSLHYTLAVEGIDQNAKWGKQIVSVDMSAEKKGTDQSSARPADALHLSRCSWSAKRIDAL